MPGGDGTGPGGAGPMTGRGMGRCGGQGRGSGAGRGSVRSNRRLFSGWDPLQNQSDFSNEKSRNKKEQELEILGQQAQDLKKQLNEVLKKIDRLNKGE